MKLFISLLLLMAISSFGAQPSYTAFRGTGGILIVSNPPNGTIIFDGSSISGSSVPGAPLSSVQFNSNGLMRGSSGFVYTNGLVGIGTTAPTNALTVNGDISLSSVSNIYRIGGIKVLRLNQNAGQDVYVGNTGPDVTTLTGGENVGIGFSALNHLTSGAANIAIGGGALTVNESGSANVAIGRHTMLGNFTGGYNTAVGEYALSGDGGFSWHSGSYNVALGANALTYNQVDGNTAVGESAMFFNTNGLNNTAIGRNALRASGVGNNNTAGGNGSLTANTTGSGNTALGGTSLPENTAGGNNTSIGALSGYNGGVSLTTLSSCTFLGYQANSTVNGIDNSTAIGSGAQVTAANQVVLGNNSVTVTSLKGSVLMVSAIITNSVTVLGTTNQVVFGATNIAPASAAAPTKWVSVQVSGDAGVYRLPLYQ